MNAARVFPWATILAAAVRTLALAPSEVWSLTPKEPVVLLGPAAGSQPLRRAALQALIAAHPDRKPDRKPDP